MWRSYASDFVIADQAVTKAENRKSSCLYYIQVEAEA